jgi:hypothetical protein
MNKPRMVKPFKAANRNKLPLVEQVACSTPGKTSSQPVLVYLLNLVAHKRDIRAKALLCYRPIIIKHAQGIG